MGISHVVAGFRTGLEAQQVTYYNDIRQLKNYRKSETLRIG